MRFRALILCAVPVGLLLLGLWFLNASDREPQETHTVRAGLFEKWTPLLGELEAAQSLTLRSELDGLATLVWLAEDGSPVEAGEPVARFDDTEWREALRTSARDVELAEAELTSLRDASHPLELRQLETERMALREEARETKVLLADTRELVDSGLIQERELLNLKAQSERVEAALSAAEERSRLTREILHPAQLRMAEARHRAAVTARDRAKERLERTEVRAPADGTVHFPVIPLDGERRRVRVGDGLYRNQAYVHLSDLSDLVVRARMPEAFIARIVPGLNARVRIPAFPELILPAVVRRVSTHPVDESRQYEVWLELADSHPMLRPGLRAEVDVLELREENVIAVPRPWLRFEDGSVKARVTDERGRTQLRELVPGAQSARQVVIQEGLREGEVIVVP